VVEISPMEPADLPAALELWAASEGVKLTDADAPDALERYLARNPGLSFVARAGGQLVGAVLCGHDGRRGYLHHLSVAPAHRRRGVGRALAERCLAALRREGIGKCHIFVVSGNDGGQAFWERVGWVLRQDVFLMSLTLLADRPDP
jgi:ribosomal protein S18 acetylase RimI-like enzyme